MDNEIYTYLVGFAENKIALLLVLFALTFLLEDVATSAAALLAASGEVDAQYAFAAVLCGIILGDLGLYMLGGALRKWPWMKRFLKFDAAQKTQDFINKRIVFSIIFARFVPGMRLVTYTAMGFFKTNFRTFALTVVFAVGAWTGLLFFMLFSLGEVFMESFKMYHEIGILALFIFGLLIPYSIGKFARKRTRSGE